MQRKQGGLVPIGEALADLPGPVQALRKTPPPARRGFTVADQVNQLVSASEADPDMGFMARTMALCSLPRTNLGNRKEYKRGNGPYMHHFTRFDQVNQLVSASEANPDLGFMARTMEDVRVRDFRILPEKPLLESVASVESISVSRFPCQPCRGSGHVTRPGSASRGTSTVR